MILLRLKIIIAAIILFLSIITGCTRSENLKTDVNDVKSESMAVREQSSDNIEIAKNYLEEKGYEVISLVS